MRVSLLTLLVVAVATAGCHVPCKQNLPPAEMLMHPGPGVDGPGPGVMMYQPGIPIAADDFADGLCRTRRHDGHLGRDGAGAVRFASRWSVPARYNFPQGAIYRLKLTNIPGRPGVELYPTLEVGPAMPRTEAFLAHNAIPVQFTEEDFDQVLSGNFVTKVIYLPDPEFQELALAGVETLVSTRLDPGVDPIVEADRRGAILAIVRLGNKDLQLPRRPKCKKAASSRSDMPVRCPAAMMPGGQMPGGPVPMGMAVGGPIDHAQQQLHLRRDRAAVRDADVRHADRTARPAARAAGSARRSAEAHDRQPHARAPARADREGSHRRETEAGLQLSEAGRPRPHRRTGRIAGGLFRPPAATVMKRLAILAVGRHARSTANPVHIRAKARKTVPRIDRPISSITNPALCPELSRHDS